MATCEVQQEKHFPTNIKGIRGDLSCWVKPGEPGWRWMEETNEILREKLAKELKESGVNPGDQNFCTPEEENIFYL